MGMSATWPGLHLRVEPSLYRSIKDEIALFRIEVASKVQREKPRKAIE
jgi:hypothetical protein